MPCATTQLLADGERAAVAGRQPGCSNAAVPACGPAGIFTEEYDVHQRQLRGNFPQAFVHALLLEAATTIAGGAGP